ncbi:MAG: hypothetical protein ACHQAY_09130 [Hyphomicrobiales bacterium]
MYLGRVVERGPRAEIFADPQHDYTRLLLSSVPGIQRAATSREASAPPH